MVANRLATSGQSWVQTFARQNSGTYNNAWHVVDWNVWSPGQPIPSGFLWFLESMPGYVSTRDLSDYLRVQTYWASYNVAFDPYIFNISGQWPLVQKYGAGYTWDQCARAQIFRREQASIVDLASYARVLRFNDYESDPVAQQGCDGHAHSAINAIAARGDLNAPDNGCDPDQGLNQQSLAAVDCKYTSYVAAAAGTHKLQRFFAQAGPTFDQQPPFVWSLSPFANASHLGMADRYQYGWVDFDAQWD
jgi:hypothetical protein